MSLSRRTCSLENCNEPHQGWGYCCRHYWNAKARGDVNKDAKYKRPEEKTGMSRHPVYSVWAAMKSRCENPNTKFYEYYGGRGIRVCSRWTNSFSNFIKDMGMRPEGMTLDRIDPNGNYEPSNCRWASRTTQMINQRKRTDNTSGYRGVSFNKNRQKWLAYYSIHRKRKELGFYETAAEAAQARKEYEDGLGKE